MRKVLLLFILCVLSIFIGKSQSITERDFDDIQAFEDDFQNSTVYAPYQDFSGDSIIIYDGEGGHRARYDYIYNTAGQLILQESQDWINNQWVKKSKVVMSYDENGHVIFKESFYAKDNAYISAGITISEYVENNLVTSEVYTSNYKKSHKLSYTYNNQNKVTQLVSYNASADDDWTLYQKTIYDYHHDGEKILEESYYFRDNEWQKSEKVIWNYDSELKLTFMENYLGVNNSWEIDMKLVYVYDEITDKELLYEVYRKKGEKNLTLTYTKTSTYDEKANLIMVEIYEKTIADPALMLKFIYEYDNENRQIYAQTFRKYEGNTEWENVTKQYFIYNDIVQSYTYEVYQYVNNNWEKNYKDVYYYNDNKEIINREYYSNKDNEWLVYLKFEYVHGEDGLLSESISYYGDNNEWIKRSHETYYYDESKNLVKSESFRLNNNNWEQENYKIFYYSRVVTDTGYPDFMINGVRIYITDQMLYIQSSYENDTITIYLPSGVKCYQGIAKSIPVAILPKGLLIISSDKGWTKKIMNN